MDVATVETLKQAFSGSIILPGDSAYDAACTTFLHKGSPAIVLQPQTSADVAIAIQYASAQALPLSIRSGGHRGFGFFTNHGGVVKNPSSINEVENGDHHKHLLIVWG